MSAASIKRRLALGALAAALLAFPAAADAAAPIVPSTSASEVTETSALLQGAVAPRQSSAEAHFEYVDQASYEASGFASANKTEDVKVPLTVKGKGDLVGPVEATGDLTEGSPTISNVNVTSGSFSLGQSVTGEGIPSSATVKSLGPGTLTLSTPVEAGKSKNAVALTGVASDKVTGLSPESGTFVAGQTISAKGGKGIKAGTSILAVSGNSLTLSQPATETISSAELTATTTFAQGSGDIQEGSGQILHVTPAAGTFVPGQVLTGAGIRSETTIRAVFPDSEPGKLRLEISRNATADGAGVALVAAAPQPITASITGLSPQTQYHLRVAATDSQGNEATEPEVVFFTLAPAPTFPACPNGTFRNGELSPFGFPSAHLPDCRSYEQATPTNKDGGDVQTYLSYAKAADNGNSVVWGSTFGAPNAEGAQQLPFFLAQRGADSSGWSSKGLLPPASLGQKGESLRGWSPDFSSTFASVIRLDDPFTEALIEQHSDGSPPTVVAPYAPLEGNGAIPTYNFAGTSADGTIVFFESRADLNGVGPSYPLLQGLARNLYAWDKATEALTLAGQMNSDSETKSLLPKGTYAGPYDWIGGAGGGASKNFQLDAEHAISDDGSVFFTSASDGQLYQRLNPTEPQSESGPDDYIENGHCAEPDKACTIHVSETQKSNGGPDQNGPDPAGPQPAAFMAASADGETAFFTSSEKLTNDANTGPEQPPAQIGTANLADPDPNATKDEDFIPAHALGVAVDTKGEYIYWADPTKNSIGRAKLNPDGTHGVIEPDFIVPGPTKYEPDPNDNPGVLAESPSFPRYVAVGPCAGGGECIYWTNAGPRETEKAEFRSSGTIGRARLNGGLPPDIADIEPEWISGAENPQGIAVNSEHVYWANARLNILIGGVDRGFGRANLDGTGVNQEFGYIGGDNATGVAVDTAHIYLAVPVGSVEFKFTKIVRYPLDQVPDREENTSNEDFISIPGKLQGISLTSSAIYWSDATNNTIGRNDLSNFNRSGTGNGSPPCVLPTCTAEFLTVQGPPTGIALNDNRLFYSTNGDSPPNPGNDLYRYRAGASPPIEDLTPLFTGNGAEVQGVLGASADGSYLYFLANGVLDDSGEARPGTCHGRPFRQASGTCNLYLWHEGTIEFIARLELGGGVSYDSFNLAQSASAQSNGAGAIEKTSFLSRDGRILLFRSVKQLTGYDNDGLAEYYRYNANDGSVLCITCNPSGVRPSMEPTLGAYDYPHVGPPPFGLSVVSARHLSADGNRFFFETAEALVSADVNGQGGCPLVATMRVCSDVYEWEAPGSGTCTEDGPAFSELNQGCIYLISTGKSAYPSFFIDASESGDDVFFITRDSLVGQDGDSITDVYDARVNGGLASQNAKPRPPCEIEGCMPNATAPPAIPTPPDISGPPDPKPKRCKAKKCKKHHKPKKARKRHPKIKHTGGSK